MTLPRNRSRPIEVDNRLYLWSASHEAGKGTHPEAPARVVVHTKKLPHGQKLVAVVDVDIARPGMVRNLIGFALKRGWRPDVPGPDYLLGLEETEQVLHIDSSGADRIIPQIIADKITLRANPSRGRGDSQEDEVPG